MKQSLLAIALATIALSSTAQAAYVYKLPLEVAGGGSLPNGTISFGNGGATTPTVPTEPEPEPVDPFEPEDKRCDPLAQSYPENYYGRDMYPAKAVMLQNGQIHWPCKLKQVDKPNLIARYMSGISGSNAGTQDANRCMYEPVTSNSCSININYIVFEYDIIRVNGEVTYKPYPLIIYKDDFFKDFGAYPQRIVIDGIECKDFKSYRKPFIKAWVTCDFNTSMDWVVSNSGKPFVIEVYSQ